MSCANYSSAMDCFLQEFDLQWKNTLNQLGENHAQLNLGHRLRPQICFWGYLATIFPEKLRNDDFAQIARAAVSIELIHKASLLLDDWIDHDAERHGIPTFHTTHGSKYSVLCALNMIGLSMTELERVLSPEIISPYHYQLCMGTLIKTIGNMAKGALNELRLHDRDFFDYTKIKEIVQLETSEIIGNGLLLGYYVGASNDRNTKVESKFKSIGDQCGYLFQAFNDLEAFNAPDQLVNHKGNLNLDLLNNRKNLVVAQLYALVNMHDKQLLHHADQETLIALVKKYHVIDIMFSELQEVYEHILHTTDQLHDIGLPAEWCIGMHDFLEHIKNFAQKRIKQ